MGVLQYSDVRTGHVLLRRILRGMVRGLQRGEAGVRNQEGPDTSPRGNGSICCGGRHVFGSKILDLGCRFEPDARNEFNLD